MFNLFKKQPIEPQVHIKILKLSHEGGFDYVLINTSFMTLQYQSDRISFTRNEVFYKHGILKYYQSVLPTDKNLGYVLAIDYQDHTQETKFVDKDQVIAAIIEIEEPYKAREIIRKIFGTTINTF